MEQEGPKALPLNSAYAFGVEHGLQQEITDVKNMEIEWDLSYTSTLRRGFIVNLFEAKGILQEFIDRHWPMGGTAWGVSKIRFWRGVKSRYDDFLAGKEIDVGDIEDAEEESHQFAAEPDLRNVLTANLGCIEPGLHLYEQGQVKGMEFQIDEGRGRIDILAVDKEDRYVVIELKLSRGRNKALGQLLYYMGWVDANLGKSPCRGMIIAKDIPPDLVLAVKRASGVSLFRYRLQVSVEAVIGEERVKTE
jgi:hypothetical protein